MNTKRPARRILQIIPAAGWWSKYTTDDHRFDLYPLVCFALVQSLEPDGTTIEDVCAMDADSDGMTEFCDQSANFAGLMHESDPLLDSYRRGDLPAI